MIVPITEENISAAGAVHAAAWRASHRAICSPEFVAAHTAERQTEYLRRELAKGKQLWLLLDPEPVGVVSLWDGLIENLYVLPEKQGRGYGRRLLRFVMAQCSHPRLTVLNTNKFAYEWYLREGFIPTGVEKKLSDALFEIEMVHESRQKEKPMSFTEHEKNGVVFHTASTLGGLPGLTHGFSTRLGGVSTGFMASMNLRGGGPYPDARENTLENYRRLTDALGANMDRLVLSKQVHEDTVRHVTSADAGKGLLVPADYTADALVTDQPGMSLMVFSADCIILLLHDPVTRSIGAVHAGWRGTALDLPAKTVREMGRLFGAKPEDIRVAVGAGIGPCCFETHDDVPDALRAAFGAGVEPYIAPRPQAPGKWSVDLKAVNAWRLREAGVNQIDVCPTCTACSADLYWSHRRTGDKRGVQGGLIGLL